MPVTAQHLDGRVALVTIDDGKVNVISPELVESLSAQMRILETDPVVRAVVIAGRVGALSAGFDLRIMLAGPQPRRDLVTAGFESVARLLTYPRPVVVACTGHAVAAGALLLLAAESRVAAAGAFRIGLNEVSVGLPVPLVAAELARDRLAPNAFTHSVLEARMYDPVAACAAGWVDEVAPADDVVSRAAAHARRLAELPPQAFSMTKEAVRRPLVERMRGALEEDLTRMDTLLSGLGGL